jgi:hypothetical protein
LAASYIIAGFSPNKLYSTPDIRTEIDCNFKTKKIIWKKNSPNIHVQYQS